MSEIFRHFDKKIFGLFCSKEIPAVQYWFILQNIKWEWSSPR